MEVRNFYHARNFYDLAKIAISKMAQICTPDNENRNISKYSHLVLENAVKRGQNTRQTTFSEKIILIYFFCIEIFRNRYHQFSGNLAKFSRSFSFDFYLHFQNDANFRISNMDFALSMAICHPRQA